LGQEISSSTWTSAKLSQLTKFRVQRIPSNKIGTLQRLFTYGGDNGLHRVDVPKFLLWDKSVYFIHLQKQRANVLVSIGLVNDYLEGDDFLSLERKF
jgi:hypothetical protein